MADGATPTRTFRWDDPLDMDSRLTDDEGMIRDAARSYARDQLLPRVVAAFADETFDRSIMTEMGEMGFLGAMLPEEYGGSNASHVAYGLIAREIEAVDSGCRSSRRWPCIRSMPSAPTNRRRDSCREWPPVS